MKRKILALVLAFSMLLSVFPLGLLSATAVTETGTSQYPFLASSYEELKELVYYAEADHSSATRHIKLVNDIYQEDITNLNGITPSFYADIVLDLAGHSITRKSNITTDEGVITLMAGKLTIKDSVGTGAIISQGEIDAALYMASSSTLVINGGTFIGVNYAIIAQGGTLIINDGDFKCSDNGWYTAYANYEPDIIINGGRFHRTANPEFPDTNRSMYLVHTGNIMINGGYFEGGIILAASKKICEHVSSSIVKINGVDTDISQNTTHGLGSGTDLVEVSPKSLISFKSINPAPDSAQKESGYSYLGQFLLGSQETNISFSAFPNALDEKFTEMGWTVGRDVTVYRQNVQYYYREYAANEAFGWNLKNNVSSGGTYKIACRIFAEYEGVIIAEKTHVFQVDVFGSNVDIVSISVNPPIAGTTPNEEVKVDGIGYSSSDADWSYYDKDDDEWYIIPDGSAFKEGERYLCSVRVTANEGYSFPTDYKNMSAYVNGESVVINKNNYNTSRMYINFEFVAAEHIMVGDIPVLKGQYLVEGASAANYSEPANPSDGYLYFGETVYLFNYTNSEDTLVFFSESLEIEAQGYSTIGSIYDANEKGTNGNLTVTLKNGSTLDVYGNSYDDYASIRIYGDLLVQGEGQLSVETYGDVYGPAVAMLNSLTVNGPRVVIYGTNNYALFGNNVSVKVNSGKLALWGVTNSFKNCTIQNDEIYVGMDALVSKDNCILWDGQTSLETYKTVWLWVQNQPTPDPDPDPNPDADPDTDSEPKPEPEAPVMLGDVNKSGDIDSMDYVLVKRAYFGTFTFDEDQQKRGDVNKSGDIDSMDYVLVKRAYFGTFVIK